MAWSDRSYDLGGPRGFDDRPLGTWWLIGITLIVQLVIWLAGGGVHGAGARTVMDWLAFSEREMFSWQIWRYLTAAFLHGSPGHLLWNMLILFFVGGILERHFGTRKFVQLYLSFAVLASLGAVVEYLIWPSPLGNATGIGASGACMGIITLLGSRFPMTQFMFWGVIPIRCWALAALLVGIDLLSISAYRGGDNVAHSVHLAGAFFGFAYGYLWPRWEVKAVELKKDRERAAAARERDRRAQDAVEMDRILTKVHEQGMDCLSPDEREFLLSQSERLKDNKRH